MQIFIAWSKGVSKEIGLELKTWLQELNKPVFRTIISEESIPSGAVWDSALDTALRKADFGILCMTEENLTSLWLCYESGALRMSTSHNAGQPGVTPILFGDVDKNQIAEPLQHFQYVKFDKTGMKKLVLDLNELAANMNESSLNKREIEARFDSAYPAFSKKIQNLLRKSIPAVSKKRRDALIDDLRQVLECLESLNIAEKSEVSTDKLNSVALDEFDAALTEFRHYDAGKAFKTLSMMGDFLLSSIRKEDLTEENQRRAQQYRELLQRSQNMTVNPAQSLAAQRLLNALSALL